MASGPQPKVATTPASASRANCTVAGTLTTAALSTPNNRTGWSLDLGVEIPVFDGFLTNAKVAEVRARIQQLKQQQLLLSNGLGLKLRSVFLQLQASEKSVQAGRDAASAGLR